MINNKKVITFLVNTCLAVVLAGCFNNEVSSKIDLPVSMPMGVVESEAPSTEADMPDEGVDPKEPDGFSEEYLGKEYGSFAEAYLDIIVENRSLLTGSQVSGDQKGNGLYVGEGKIAVVDVFGDETPELLCLYPYKETIRLSDGLEPSPFSLYLKIFTYSDTEGVESVFDDFVYPIVGGEHYYCVYLTRDGDPMVFLGSSGTAYVGEFYPIIPNQNIRDEEGFFSYNSSFAKLYYISNSEVEFCTQYGEEISEDKFAEVSKGIMGDIDRVLFQGPVYEVQGELKQQLYHVELWRDIIPFEEENMTYDEAVAWLEIQTDNQ